MDPLFWSIICVVLMLCMVVVELLTPSMGGFTLAALTFSGLSVYTGFKHSPSAGFVMLAVNVTLFPVAILVGIHFLRRSPVINEVQNPSGIQSAPDSQPLHKLKGEIGKSITPLRPAGAAMINDQKVDVVTEGKFVEAGVVVKVIRVNGAIVVVEAVA
ncbi:MAG TPA: NfeD family protein [Planctomycetota bacterium]|nr:NfeD family protein [Planctomycetota bacterium]